MKDLETVYKHFPTHEACIKQIEKFRWVNSPICPYCKSKNHTSVPRENRYHCNTCNTSFSVTVGTIFHKTKVDLQKWFFAIYLTLSQNTAPSARQLGIDLKVTKDTAWFMLMRIQNALSQYRELMQGIIEYEVKKQ